MKMIVAVDINWGIGYKGDMLAYIPEDLKRFKKITMENKVIIMGRKTLESLPNGKPLKDRINVVITRDKNYSKDGVIVVHSIDECISYLNNNNLLDNATVIGGATIYKQFMKYCDTAYITKINKAFDNVDTYIDNLDNNKSWIIENEGGYKLSTNGLDYKFVDYKKL